MNKQERRLKKENKWEEQVRRGGEETNYQVIEGSLMGRSPGAQKGIRAQGV